MKPRIISGVIIAMVILAPSLSSFAGGPLDPVRLGTWTLSVGVGPGTHPFGNGVGFGPAEKMAFEAGLWDAGPGVIAIGGEAAFSFFAHHYGDEWNESWANFMFGARGSYHYGWDVEGLDTYAGLPLGVGFTAHSGDDKPGYKGVTPVFPYLGFYFGASYFFNKLIGVNGEVGFNSTYANIGVIFKLK